MLHSALHPHMNETQVWGAESCAYPSPCENFAWKCELWKGHIKAALGILFAASSEHAMQIHKKPTMTVRSTKQYAKGDLLIVPMSRDVHMSKTVIPNTPVVENCFEQRGWPVSGYIKSSQVWPTNEGTESFLSSYWCIRADVDQDNANATVMKQDVSISIAVAAGKHLESKVSVPVLVNTKPIEVGDEVVLLKPKKHVLAKAVEEPAPKRVKGGRAQSKSKGKGGAKKGKP